MKLNEQKELVLTKREYNKILALVTLDCEVIRCKECPFTEKDGTCLLIKLSHIVNHAKRGK